MIVLDTHAWVWWVNNPENLSHRARKAVDSAMKNDAILISSIRTWEVALLAARDRLKLTMEVTDWIAKS
jgi:PIN domain nuclease of toxin-antitoxin system